MLSILIADNRKVKGNISHLIDSYLMILIIQGRSIPDLYDLYYLYDLYDLAHVAGQEPYNPHDLAHASWVGSVLLIDRSCRLSQRQVMN